MHRLGITILKQRWQQQQRRHQFRVVKLIYSASFTVVLSRYRDVKMKVEVAAWRRDPDTRPNAGTRDDSATPDP